MQAQVVGPAQVLKYFIFSFIEPPVPAGAPGPPEEYRERRLDIFKKIVPRPEATYIWQAAGESMTGARIHSGDFMVVDCSVVPTLGKVVVATLNGGNTVKRLGVQDNRGFLLPENPNYEPIPIDEDDGVKVVGVVTWVFHPIG